MSPEIPVPIFQVLKALYWRFRRNPRVAPHVAAVLISFARHCLAWGVRKHILRDRRPVLAISLVEHMGDIVAAEPIVRAARQRFPHHRIVWILKSAYAELAASYPDVNGVVTVRCLTESMLLHAAGIVDQMWDLHLRGRICEWCCIPIVKSGPGPDMETYFRFGNLLTIQCLSAGIPPLSDGPVLSPPTHVAVKVDRLGLPDRFLVIHCVSNDGTKDWPAASWQQLVARITADLQVDVVELGLWPLVIERDDMRVRSLCGQLSILETAEVIRRASLFIGIDSGPAHLANAVGTPGIVLLGPYLGVDDYMPFSGRYQDGTLADLLRGRDSVDSLSVETVLAAVIRRLRTEGAVAAAPAVACPR